MNTTTLLLFSAVAGLAGNDSQRRLGQKLINQISLYRRLYLLKQLSI
jgi:hypothetical protein